ncbi:MAG: hypothetical protein ABL930_13365, partial [Pseudobdellovibrio sp.]
MKIDTHLIKRSVLSLALAFSVISAIPADHAEAARSCRVVVEGETALMKIRGSDKLNVKGAT